MGRVWLLVAVLRGSLSVVIAALRGRCISCILCKVERICLNYIKGKDYFYYYYYYWQKIALHLCRRQYGSSVKHFDVSLVGSQAIDVGEITQKRL